MSRIFFIYEKENKKHAQYLKQLAAIYNCGYTECVDEFVVECFLSNNSSQNPDSMVAVRKFKNLIAVYTPIEFKSTAALSIYISQERYQNIPILVFQEEDAKAVNIGNAMRKNGKFKVQFLK